MAFDKPTRVARFAGTPTTETTESAEPSSGKKDIGWTLDDEPPASFFNWLHYRYYKWIRWFNERVDDGLRGGGGTSDDVLLHGPAPATNNPGGVFEVHAADGDGTGAGGAVKVRGGNAGATGAQGGEAGIVAGDSVADHGDTTTVLGGRADGTDKNGGPVILSSGIATGDGYGSVSIDAVDGGQGAGAVDRLPSSYIAVDGQNAKIVTSRALELSGGVKGDVLPDASASYDIGEPVSAKWDKVYAQQFVPNEFPQVPANQRELQARHSNNGILAYCMILFDGASAPTLRAPHWNVASVSRTSAGLYLVTLDQAIHNLGHAAFFQADVAQMTFRARWLTSTTFNLLVNNASTGAATDVPTSQDGYFMIGGQSNAAF